jgi:hypothetical protein
MTSDCGPSQCHKGEEASRKVAREIPLVLTGMEKTENPSNLGPHPGSCFLTHASMVACPEFSLGQCLWWEVAGDRSWREARPGTHEAPHWERLSCHFYGSEKNFPCRMAGKFSGFCGWGAVLPVISHGPSYQRECHMDLLGTLRWARPQWPIGAIGQIPFMVMGPSPPTCAWLRVTR